MSDYTDIYQYLEFCDVYDDEGNLTGEVKSPPCLLRVFKETVKVIGSSSALHWGTGSTVTLILLGALGLLLWWKWNRWHIPCILIRCFCWWRNHEPQTGTEGGTCQIRLKAARAQKAKAEDDKQKEMIAADKAEDDEQKERIAAKNGLESYCFNKKSTGSDEQEKITITIDKGRLSKEEIERMGSDAEKFKTEDDKQMERIVAKKGLEYYCLNMKSTIENEKFKDKIAEDDKKIIMDKYNEIIAWLNANQTAEEDEYNDKQKEVEGICNPIITKLYQSAGGRDKIVAVCTPVLSRFEFENE